MEDNRSKSGHEESVEVREFDYLKWTCDGLMRELANELDRRETMRRHAQQGFIFVPPALAAATAIALRNEALDLGAIVAFACMAASGIVAIVAWFIVTATGEYPRVSVTEVFTVCNGTSEEKNYLYRLKRARDDLARCVTTAQGLGNKLATRRTWVLASSGLALAFAAIGVIVQAQSR